MTQADCVHSTPPTNTSKMDPPVDSKRRRLLTVAAAGAVGKRTPKAADADIAARRAKAYADMENSVCEVARMGEIANMLFDEPDTGLFVFAVGHLDWMLRRFKERYYAVEFPISD
jgi:hypothetical protein